MRRAIWNDLLYGARTGVGGKDEIMADSTTSNTTLDTNLNTTSSTTSINVDNTVTENVKAENNEIIELNGDNSSERGREFKNTEKINEEKNIKTETDISSLIKLKRKNLKNPEKKLKNSDGTYSVSTVSTGTGLELSGDVDVPAIACKYELTGGFIKNAVLSALLSAISRANDKSEPVLTQVRGSDSRIILATK